MSDRVLKKYHDRYYLSFTFNHQYIKRKYSSSEKFLRSENPALLNRHVFVQKQCTKHQGSTKAVFEICSKLTLRTREQRH